MRATVAGLIRPASALFLLLAPSVFASQSCSLTIADNGAVSGQCSAAAVPAPTPAPTPTPAPAPTPTPAPPPVQPPAGVMQMLSEGSNHWNTAAMPGTTLTWALPVSSGSINFASFPLRTAGGMELEVSISAVPGDFSSYKSNVIWGQTPCGFRTGQVDATIRWGQASFLTCGVPPGAQWYLNVRYHGSTCPTNMSPPGCAVTFGWHRG